MCTKSIVCQSLNAITPVLFLITLDNEVYQAIIFVDNVLSICGIGFNFFIYYNFNRAFYTTFNDLAQKFRNKFKK